MVPAEHAAAAVATGRRFVDHVAGLIESHP
jgi:hypothetical protein